MEAIELLEIIARGEDSRYQFKANVTNVTSLAQEMVAFSNFGGGSIFIGVTDEGDIANLGRDDMGRLNQLISNAASQHVRPPINPKTENIPIDDKLVMRVTIPDGIKKPYMDKNGAIWVRSGSDKRKATAQEEIQRFYQSAGLISGDKMPVPGTSIADIDLDYFKDFYNKNFWEPLDRLNLSLANVLRNMNLMKDDALNIAGTLLFSQNADFHLPVFIVKAIAFPGDKIHATEYIDSRDITGKLAHVFRQSVSFILGNIQHLQGRQSVNSTGEPSIPRIVPEELIANALIHRDYLVSAPVRIFIFSNRVEIISPGHLPNNLTVENIKLGISNIRNPVLASFATKILPYRGLGSGIIRALQAYHDIEFESDRDGNLFKVMIQRPKFTIPAK